MQRVDRIEKRRFVGREFLLWLWFESETRDGTVRTAAHGSFGLWIERQIVLSAGAEGTRIKGAAPAHGREAKESLRRGKLPESMGLRLVVDHAESSFTLKAEQLAIGGLKLPTALGGVTDDVPTPLLDVPRRRPRRKREDAARQEARESDEMHESFYERMGLAREVELRLEALFADFLALRLGDRWGEVVAAMRAWSAGEAVEPVARLPVAPRSLGSKSRTGERTKAVARG